MSQPPSRPSLTSGEATSRRRSLPSQPKTFSGTRRPSLEFGSGTRRPSPYPQHQLLRGWRRPVSTPPTPSKSTPSGTRRPSPYPKTQPPRGWRRPVSSLPRPRKPNFLGRDVPAPIQILNRLGARDVPSPHFPRPRNARHQFGTSPVLTQPVFKTLKGFQTVAGGKAVRPPPPVPRPQNVQPPPLAEGVGGGGIPESPQAVSPDASRCSAIPRRRKKAHRRSLPRANVICAGRGAARVRSVLRLSAWSAGPRSPPRSLKAEVQRAEASKDALRVTKQRRDHGFHGFRGWGRRRTGLPVAGRSRPSGTAPSLPPCSPALSYPWHPRHPR